MSWVSDFVPLFFQYISMYVLILLKHPLSDLNLSRSLLDDITFCLCLSILLIYFSACPNCPNLHRFGVLLGELNFLIFTALIMLYFSVLHWNNCLLDCRIFQVWDVNAKWQFWIPYEIIYDLIKSSLDPMGSSLDLLGLSLNLMGSSLDLMRSNLGSEGSIWE